MPDQNGAPIALPKIEIYFDPQTQDVDLRFNAQDWRSWNFVVAALEMAKRMAEINWQANRIAVMQQSQAQANLDKQIAKRIIKGL